MIPPVDLGRGDAAAVAATLAAMDDAGVDHAVDGMTGHVTILWCG